MRSPTAPGNPCRRCIRQQPLPAHAFRQGVRHGIALYGLNAVQGDYFSVLDDDDWLFSNHFEELFRPFPPSPQHSFFAFSGSVSIEAEPRVALGGSLDRRHVSRFGPHITDRIDQIASCIATNTARKPKYLAAPSHLPLM